MVMKEFCDSQNTLIAKGVKSGNLSSETALQPDRTDFKE